MNQCPYCQNTEHQIKAGRTGAGSQRYRRKPCDRRYTPQPSQMYSDEMRRRAVRFYADGLSYRQIGRHLGVHHVTVINWVKAHADQLSPAVPDKRQTYRVEGVNAELRHYLARLRHRSRCFSRCVKVPGRSVKLFVYAWNRRQLYRHEHPSCPAHLIQFLYPIN